MHRALAVSLCLALALATGCGDDGDTAAPPPDPATEPADAAVDPPRGWRTLLNRRVGFTVALPRQWSAKKRRDATVVRSGDGLLALTIAADRGEPGRDLAAARYARRTLEGLPGLGRLVPRDRGAVRGSPYETAVFEATGVRATGEAGVAKRQRITVAALRRPGRVTYTVVAFANAEVPSPGNSRALTRVLRSLRGRAPAP
ncbi:MAG TPA: hypothetical protein VNT32_01560 [Thermoleophilaceae bacterium]|nr:hypothetical protein [Thermoleophilaceae bacterium]